MKKFDIFCIFYCIALLSFGFKNTNTDVHGSKTSGANRKTENSHTYTTSLELHSRTSGSPYYTDNFDGANDTTSLKARGYKVYYRGTGPQGFSATWFQGNPAIFVALNGPTNGYVASNFQTVTLANTIDNWLVLPAKNVLVDDSLYFSSRSPTGSTFPDSIRVMYSAVGDSVPEAASWVELGRFKAATSGSWERRGFKAPTAGTTARFAIRYAVVDGGPDGTNSDYIGIDALTIERPGIANDVGVSANVAPVGTIQANSATIAPKATVTNFGSNNQSITSAFNVTYSISPGGYSSTKTVAALASGASTTVTFDSTFVPSPVGTYNGTIISNLGSDQNRINDTLRTTFSVVEMNWGGGGPNSGGYYFANSVAVGAPSRPTYNWIDPVASGHTQATFADFDDGVISVGMGFNFTYFGTLFSTGTNNLNIFTNGFLTLGTPGSPAFFLVTAIPDAFNPPNLIAACLVDLDLTPANYPMAKIYYGGNANQFVVTYFHCYRWVSGGNSTNYVTFQVFFFPNGNIKIQYNDAESVVPPTVFTSQGDIGIQNALGNAGLQYRVDGVGGPMFSSPLALEYGTNPNAVPVQLASFTARLQQNAVRLDWRTLSEVNNYGFYVERKRDNELQYANLANNFVAGHGTTLEPHSYSFTDNSTTSGVYHYRLRQVDLDGTQHFTEPVTINVSTATSVEETAPKLFALFQNYPNPFNPETQIKFSVAATARTSLELYTTLGQKVATLFDDVAEAGRYYTIRVSGSSLSSGIYFYKLQSGTKTDFKKMMLLR